MKKVQLAGLILLAVCLISITAYNGRNSVKLNGRNGSHSSEISQSKEKSAETVIVEVETSAAWKDEAYSIKHDY